MNRRQFTCPALRSSISHPHLPNPLVILSGETSCSLRNWRLSPPHLPFAKLARIKQLGPAHLVYPGATHTRRAHSIGVLHMARRLAWALAARGSLAFVSKRGALFISRGRSLPRSGALPLRPFPEGATSRGARVPHCQASCRRTAPLACGCDRGGSSGCRRHRRSRYSGQE